MVLGALLAIGGDRATSSRLLRAFFFAHPLLMAITVTATGNHYFIDSIAGATAALAALALVALYRRSRSSASSASRSTNSFQVVPSLPRARNEPAPA
jgi:lysylphosphatidylglycerol synthetase-like protein (DUF2156 family)